MSYVNLLGEYEELFSTQPTEIQDTINLCKTYKNDQDIQSVLEFLSKEEIQYITYSHN